MNWDEILNNLPVMTRPTKITAIQFVKDDYSNRGDNEVRLESMLVYNGIDVGYGLVDLFTSDGPLQVPANTELLVIWDNVE